MERKINIEISLSRNYDKISLGLLDEPISYETEEQFKELIKQEFSLLKGLVLDEFKDKIQTEATSTTTSGEIASDKQKNFLMELGYEGSFAHLTRVEATSLIKSLIGKRNEKEA